MSSFRFSRSRRLKPSDSTFFANDVFPDRGGRPQPASLWIYGEGVDAAWKRALDAGCQVKMPIANTDSVNLHFT